MPAHGTIDFVAYDKKGGVVLLAEAKSRRGTSEIWASRLRKNMLSHGTLPGSKLFLIATPERMYLWKERGEGKDGKDPGAEQTPDARYSAPPEYTADAQKLLEPYFARLDQAPSEIGPEAFEFLVLTWLVDIAGSGRVGMNQGTSSELISELAGSLQETRIEMHPLQ